MSDREEEEYLEYLRRSREQVGELEPVIVSESGFVIDGRHRLKAYPGWHKVVVPGKDVDALMKRIHRSIKSRVPTKERKMQLMEFAIYLEQEGVKQADMITELTKRVPFSEQYIRKLLPKKYKRGYPEERVSVSGVYKRPDKSKLSFELEKPVEAGKTVCPACHSILTKVTCPHCFVEIPMKDLGK